MQKFESTCLVKSESWITGRVLQASSPTLQLSPPREIPGPTKETVVQACRELGESADKFIIFGGRKT